MKDHIFGEALFNVFCLFLDRDDNLLRQLNDCGQDIIIESDAWYFSVPALYGFVVTRLPEIEQLDYQTFRKMLFEFPFNQMLKSIGAEISISKNNKKLDLSIYRLGFIQIPSSSR